MRVTLRPRDSRIAASDAAAMPLPSEDTTPPVTKTNLVIAFSTRSARVLWWYSAIIGKGCFVIPAKAGTQRVPLSLDPRLRGGDESFAGVTTPARGDDL